MQIPQDFQFEFVVRTSPEFTIFKMHTIAMFRVTHILRNVYYAQYHWRTVQRFNNDVFDSTTFTGKFIKHSIKRLVLCLLFSNINVNVRIFVFL